jgi:hypothetical protein
MSCEYVIMYSYNQREYALNENWNESNGLSYAAGMAAEVLLPRIRIR